MTSTTLTRGQAEFEVHRFRRTRPPSGLDGRGGTRGRWWGPKEWRATGIGISACPETRVSNQLNYETTVELHKVLQTYTPCVKVKRGSGCLIRRSGRGVRGAVSVSFTLQEGRGTGGWDEFYHELSE